MTNSTISRALAFSLALAVIAYVVVRSRSSSEPAVPASAGAVHGGSPAVDSLLLAGLTLTVHKSPTCGCCKAWVKHMEAAGFKVVALDHADMAPIKREHGVPKALESCHTSKIGAYVIEGHVPAEDVLRLLQEKPEVAGLTTTPAMPNGSPGMEGLVKEKYDVLTFDKSGATKVFSHR